jgi:hypothetical protein
MHALGLLDGVADAEVTGFLLALVVGNFSGDVLEGASIGVALLARDLELAGARFAESGSIGGRSSDAMALEPPKLWETTHARW